MGRATVIAINTSSLDVRTSDCFSNQGQTEFSGLLWQFLMFISICLTEAPGVIVNTAKLI